jgi:hypothetical protein
MLLHFKFVILVLFFCFQLDAFFFSHLGNLVVLGPYLVELFLVNGPDFFFQVCFNIGVPSMCVDYTLILQV